ncbi:hypothetical protein ACF0H5_009713 [Mactra antiquata]
MKLFLLALLATSLVCSEAYKRVWRTPPCVNCYGEWVGPHVTYFDGCNYCRCNKYWQIETCTLRYCKWNECFWKRG